MKLPDYIQTTGDAACAALFQVSEHTIDSWKYGKRQPRPEKAVEIEKLTEGRVTVREIYERAA